MAKRWNETVNPQDTVYYLGDFAMQFRSAEYWAPRLNGEKVMVIGNHDKAWPYRKGYEIYVQKYIDIGFKLVVTEMKLQLPLNGKIAQVKLNHLPYAGPQNSPYDDKYAKYRPKNEGEILLCGHIHEKWTKIGKMINVGVDCHDFRPITIERIEQILAGPDSPSKNSDSRKPNYDNL